MEVEFQGKNHHITVKFIMNAIYKIHSEDCLFIYVIKNLFNKNADILLSAFWLYVQGEWDVKPFFLLKKLWPYIRKFSSYPTPLPTPPPSAWPPPSKNHTF